MHITTLDHTKYMNLCHTLLRIMFTLYVCPTQPDSKLSFGGGSGSRQGQGQQPWRVPVAFFVFVYKK